MSYFTEHFWGEKNHGFDVLYHNMKHGQISTKELADFVRERAAIEENYAKAMVKLSKMATNGTQLGTFAPLWEVFRISSDKLALCHLELMKKLHELIKDISRYAEEQGRVHKKSKEEVAGTLEAVQLLQGVAQLLPKSRESYHSKCQEYERLRREGTSQKDIDKAELKSRKAGEALRRAVEKYNAARADFEQRMLESAMRFQEVEEAHLRHMKGLIGSYSHSVEDTHVQIGQVHEEFKQNVQNIGTEALLRRFAESKGTGRERPGALDFEAYRLAPAQEGPRRSRSKAFRIPGLGRRERERDAVESPDPDLGGPEVDEDGFTVRPDPARSELDNPGCSSSDSDYDEEEPRKFRVLIKPLQPQEPPQATEEQLRATVGHLSLAPALGGTGRRQAGRQVTSLTPSDPEGTLAAGDSGGRGLPAAQVNSGPAKPPQDPQDPPQDSAALFGPPLESAFEEFPAPRSCSSPSSSSSSSPENVPDSGLDSPSHPPPGPSPESRPWTPQTDPKNPSRPWTPQTDPKNPSRPWTPQADPKNPSRPWTPQQDPKNPSRPWTPQSDPPNSSWTPQTDPKNPSRPWTPQQDPPNSSWTPQTDPPNPSWTPQPDPPNPCWTPQQDPKNPSRPWTPQTDPPNPSWTPQTDPKNPSRPWTPQTDPPNPSWTPQTEPPNPSRPWTPQSDPPNPPSFAPFGAAEGLWGVSGVSGVAPPRSRSRCLTEAPPSPDPFGDPPVWGEPPPPTRPSSHSSSSSSPAPPSGGGSCSPSPWGCPGVALGEGGAAGEAQPEPEPPWPSAAPRDVPLVAPPRRSRTKRSGPAAGSNSDLSRSLSPSPSWSCGPSHSAPASLSERGFFTAAPPALGLSRGPSPVVLGSQDALPVASAFTEYVHAYFKGRDADSCLVKVTGELTMSFPAGIVRVFGASAAPPVLSFRLLNAAAVEQFLPNAELLYSDPSQSDPSTKDFWLNMGALSAQLQRQAEQSPGAPYYNVVLLKYQFSRLGPGSAPLRLAVSWDCSPGCTRVTVEYGYNGAALALPAPLANVTVLLPLEEPLGNLRLQPAATWNLEEKRLLWKLLDVPGAPGQAGSGRLSASWEPLGGRSKPSPVAAQFSGEGSTLSGLELQLPGAAYRVSLLKKRFATGIYLAGS